MPLYEFHCDNCDEEFEELLSSLDSKDDVTCPSCGNQSVHKLLSGFTMASSSSVNAGASSCSSNGPFR